MAISYDGGMEPPSPKAVWILVARVGKAISCYTLLVWLPGKIGLATVNTGCWTWWTSHLMWQGSSSIHIRHNRNGNSSFRGSISHSSRYRGDMVGEALCLHALFVWPSKNFWLDTVWYMMLDWVDPWFELAGLLRSNLDIKHGIIKKQWKCFHPE